MVRRAQHWEGGSGGLIGRSHEIDEIEAALERLTAGRPWLLCAVGEPGIGKSRMLAELAWRAERRGYLVLVGRAAEFEQDFPFGLIVEALDKHLGALEPAAFGSLDEASAGELASIFPALAHLGTSVPTGRGAGDRHWAQYAIRGMLERLASRQPVVLVLDDVHWADGASVEVIAHISRRFRGPLLVALAFRQAPARLASALSTAERGGFGTRLELPPLTSREASELAGPGFDARTQDILYQESGGNPFYLEQLVRYGDPREVRAMLSKEHPSAAGALPLAVATAIREELATIGEDARVMLDAAAVAGESFEPELIGAIADRSLPFDALDELLAADLIRPTTVPRRFRFRHPIVRRAVYDDMRRGWQVSAHARAASALAAAGAPPTARAHHVERSANQGDEEAITLLVDAARGAAPRAPLTTGHWLRGAVSLLADDGASERRISLLTEAAAAFAAAGAYEDSLGSYE
jgi:predicted ATPase